MYKKYFFLVFAGSIFRVSCIRVNSHCTTIQTLFWLAVTTFHLWSDWYPRPLLSTPHQFWHSCLEENWFLLPPQPPYTNGLHSPERGWKYHSRTYSEQAPSDIGSRQWSVVGTARWETGLNRLKSLCFPIFQELDMLLKCFMTFMEWDQ